MPFPDAHEDGYQAITRCGVNRVVGLVVSGVLATIDP